MIDGILSLRGFRFLRDGVCMLLGLAIGFFIHAQFGGSHIVPGDIYPIRENNSEYKFISPLLYYQVPQDPNEYKPIATKIRKLIADGSSGVSASVYYRELKTGHWFGVNEEDGYTPASLLKVVVMMAYFKEAETHPAILSQGIRFTSAVQDLIGVIPYDHGTQLRLNKIYVASDLIDRMIISSDNGATYALISRLADGVLDKIFHELRLKNPQELGRDYTISSKEYALFYRALYNATYLNRTMSERALALLSKTDFADGLVAGVPHGIVVSHKYGEAVVGAGTRDQSVELHDCGIIYHPTSPYLLCVMTRERGIDLNAAFERARALVQGISGAVYESVR